MCVCVCVSKRRCIQTVWPTFNLIKLFRIKFFYWCVMFFISFFLCCYLYSFQNKYSFAEAAVKEVITLLWLICYYFYFLGENICLSISLIKLCTAWNHSIEWGSIRGNSDATSASKLSASLGVCLATRRSLWKNICTLLPSGPHTWASSQPAKLRVRPTLSQPSSLSAAHSHFPSSHLPS